MGVRAGLFSELVPKCSWFRPATLASSSRFSSSRIPILSRRRRFSVSSSAIRRAAACGMEEPLAAHVEPRSANTTGRGEIPGMT